MGYSLVGSPAKTRRDPERGIEFFYPEGRLSAKSPLASTAFVLRKLRRLNRRNPGTNAMQRWLFTTGGGGFEPPERQILGVTDGLHTRLTPTLRLEWSSIAESYFRSQAKMGPAWAPSSSILLVGLGLYQVNSTLQPSNCASRLTRSLTRCIKGRINGCLGPTV
jgi:hypothetical protein